MNKNKQTNNKQINIKPQNGWSLEHKGEMSSRKPGKEMK
jgi:hypothetical protein